MRYFWKRLRVHSVTFSNKSGGIPLPETKRVQTIFFSQKLKIWQFISQSTNNWRNFILKSAALERVMVMVEVHLPVQTWLAKIMTRREISKGVARPMEMVLMVIHPISQQYIFQNRSQIILLFQMWKNCRRIPRLTTARNTSDTIIAIMVMMHCDSNGTPPPSRGRTRKPIISLFTLWIMQTMK